MTSTLTPNQEQAIRDRFARQSHIPSGLGTEEAACTVAGINLALTGHLTDTVPACMSAVIGQWAIVIQDAIPAEMRDSQEWRELIPYAAGTGREHEPERLAIIMDWMWGTVLPSLQGIADTGGFGDLWRDMYTQRSAGAADDAAADAAAWDAAWASLDPISLLRGLITVSVEVPS